MTTHAEALVRRAYHLAEGNVVDVPGLIDLFPADGVLNATEGALSFWQVRDGRVRSTGDDAVLGSPTAAWISLVSAGAMLIELVKDWTSPAGRALSQVFAGG